MKQTVLGLTGSIGMGKSTVAQMLRDAGIPVFCADTTNHAMRAPNGAALPIYEKFVPGSTGDAGANMAMIKEFVYASSDNLMGLTRAILPLILHTITQFKYDHRNHEIIAFDIPLLFELDLDYLCDKIVVVSAGEDEQRRRVLARGIMTIPEFEKIKAAQLSDGDKRQRADYIIDTSGSLDYTREQVRELRKKLHGLNWDLLIERLKNRELMHDFIGQPILSACIADIDAVDEAIERLGHAKHLREETLREAIATIRETLYPRNAESDWTDHAERKAEFVERAEAAIQAII